MTYPEQVAEAAKILGKVLSSTVFNARHEGALRHFGGHLLDDACVNALRVVYKKAVLTQILDRNTSISAEMMDAIDRTLDDVLIRMVDDLHEDVRERLGARDAFITNTPEAKLVDGNVVIEAVPPENDKS